MCILKPHRTVSWLLIWELADPKVCFSPSFCEVEEREEGEAESKVDLSLKLRLRRTLTKALAARTLRTSSPQLQIRPVVLKV